MGPLANRKSGNTLFIALLGFYAIRTILSVMSLFSLGSAFSDESSSNSVLWVMIATFAVVLIEAAISITLSIGALRKINRGPSSFSQVLNKACIIMIVFAVAQALELIILLNILKSSNATFNALLSSAGGLAVFFLLAPATCFIVALILKIEDYGSSKCVWCIVGFGLYTLLTLLGFSNAFRSVLKFLDFALTLTFCVAGIVFSSTGISICSKNDAPLERFSTEDFEKPELFDYDPDYKGDSVGTLKDLKDRFDKGLISKEEYDRASMEIIEKL